MLSSTLDFILLSFLQTNAHSTSGEVRVVSGYWLDYGEEREEKRGCYSEEVWLIEIVGDRICGMIFFFFQFFCGWWGEGADCGQMEWWRKSSLIN